MIIQCPYCNPDTAGNHEMGCPNYRGPTITYTYPASTSDIPGAIPCIQDGPDLLEEVKRLAIEAAALRTQLKDAEEVIRQVGKRAEKSRSWDANHMDICAEIDGLVDVYRAKYGEVE